MAANEERISPEEALELIGEVQNKRRAGYRRGLYSRLFAALVCLWAGFVAFILIHDARYILLAVAPGLIAIVLWYRNAGARIREVNSLKDLILVLFLVGVMIVAVLAGFYAKDELGASWASYAAGAIIAGGLFAIMEITHGPHRRALKRDNGN